MPPSQQQRSSPLLQRRSPLTATAATALLACVSSSSSLPRAAADDSFVFISNGLIDVGIDATRGGSIGYLGTSGAGGRNLVNTFDMGREVQVRRRGDGGR